MTTKTNVKAGAKPIPSNHNETMTGFTVRTSLKAGRKIDGSVRRGLATKTNVKAGQKVR